MAKSSRLHLPIAGRYWLLAVAGLTLTGLVKNINLILLVAYFLVGLFVINWWLVRRSLRRVVARRLPAPGVLAGEYAAWRIVVEGDTTPGLTVHDAVAGHTMSRAIDGPTTEFRQLVPATRRGVFAPGPGYVACSAPFGLLEVRRLLHGNSPLVVYPRHGRLRLDRLLQHLRVTGRGRERRRSVVRQLVEGVDLHGLRPYRPGDSPRWIHWRTTARQGELMVREFETGALPGLFVAIDADWLGRGDTVQRFESTLEFLTTLVWDWSVSPEGRLHVAWPGAPVRSLTDRAQAIALLHEWAAAQPKDWHGVTQAPPADYRLAVVHVADGTMATSSGVTVDPTVSSDWYDPPRPAD